MFQFTREFIVNDNAGKIVSGLSKVKFLYDSALETLLVDNMINIRKKDVLAIYKHDYAAPVDEMIKITPSATVAAGDLIRMVITLEQEGRAISTFNSAYPNPTREVFAEAVVPTGSTAIPTAALVAAINSTRAGVDDVKYVSVSEASGVITITALDEYTRIKDVKIVKVGVASGSPLLTGYGDYVVLFEKAHKDFASLGAGNFAFGSLGAGTVAHILHDLRLQTSANDDPYGTQKDERPLPNGHYAQFTVEMMTERRNIGHAVMGEVSHSLSTAIFFVEDSIQISGTSTAADLFEAALNNLKTVTVAELSDALALHEAEDVNDVELSATAVSVTAAAGASHTAYVTLKNAPADVTIDAGDGSKATAAYSAQTGKILITGVAAGSVTVKVGTSTDAEKFGKIVVVVA